MTVKKYDDVVGVVSELARQCAPAAIATLKEICEDRGMQASDRIKAANSLLDRGFGKPHQAVSIEPRDMNDQELAGKVWGILNRHLDKFDLGESPTH